MLCLILSIFKHILQKHLVVDRVSLTKIVLEKLIVYHLMKLRHSHSNLLSNNQIFWQKCLNNKIESQLA